MYDIHYEQHGKVKLSFYKSGAKWARAMIDREGKTHILADLIMEWMGPMYWWSSYHKVFLRTARYAFHQQRQVERQKSKKREKMGEAPRGQTQRRLGEVDKARMLRKLRRRLFYQGIWN
jgi:hypothetical protein